MALLRRSLSSARLDLRVCSRDWHSHSPDFHVAQHCQLPELRS